MVNLTHEDVQNILKLIARVKDISGAEAPVVAFVQQKLANLAKELTPPATEEKVATE